MSVQEYFKVWKRIMPMLYGDEGCRAISDFCKYLEGGTNELVPGVPGLDASNPTPMEVTCLRFARYAESDLRCYKNSLERALKHQPSDLEEFLIEPREALLTKTLAIATQMHADAEKLHDTLLEEDKERRIREAREFLAST